MKIIVTLLPVAIAIGGIISGLFLREYLLIKKEISDFQRSNADNLNQAILIGRAIIVSKKEAKRLLLKSLAFALIPYGTYLAVLLLLLTKG